MSTPTVYTLTAGQATDWMDLRPFTGSSFSFMGATSGGGIATLQIANDASTAKADSQDYVSYSSSTFAIACDPPLPNFCRIKNTSGTGTVVVTFGQALRDGVPSQVNKVAVSAGGPSNEMP